jgi:hypothetical protein
MSTEFRFIKGLNWFSVCVGLWAVVYTRQVREIAVELFYALEEMPNGYPLGLFYHGTNIVTLKLRGVVRKDF